MNEYWQKMDWTEKQMKKVAMKEMGLTKKEVDKYWQELVDNGLVKVYPKFIMLKVGESDE